MGSWNPRANEIFLRAVEIAAPEERESYVARTCAGDADLRAQVDALLDAIGQAGSFLESPAVTVATDPFPIAEGPGTVIGPYKLLEQIGEGGMGVVYMADQMKPVRRKAALKIIKPGMDTRQVIARFEAERQALAMMDHPNIARVFDAGATDSGRPYFVMELVKGVPINRFCDERRLTPRARLELFIPVCEAVQHAHQKGIIHRDLKPSNVLIALYDGRPVPKVIDFGVAKAIGQKLTEATLYTGFGAIIGTLEYMSPEQAELNQLDIDTRSDIYSLGVLLYELLTGSTPLKRGLAKESSLLELLRIIREEDPPKPSTRLSATEELPSIAAHRSLEPKKLRGLVRGELDWIVMRSLEKDRNRRYDTANSLARDVTHFLSDEPVSACPQSMGYRMWKFLRKYRSPVVVVLVISALLVSGIVGTTIGLVRAIRAEAEAVGQRDLALAATEAEKVARQAETAERREAQAVTEFLESLFVSLDRLEIGQRLTLKVRDRLEAVAAGLEKEAAGEPLIQARLRHALGETLLEFGDFGRAVTLLKQALADRRRLLGDGHPQTLTTETVLAYAYHAVGRIDDAVPLFEEAFNRRNTELGPDHPDTLSSLHNLAYGYQAAGRLDEALSLYQQALEGRKTQLGPDHHDTLGTLQCLASCYHTLGRVDEALSLYQQVLKVRTAQLGPDDPDTLATLKYLGCLLRDSGRSDKALPILEQVLKKQTTRFGTDHPYTLATQVHLARAYQVAGRLEGALRLFEEVAQKLENKRGSDHPDTLSAKNDLARTYEAAGELERAEHLARDLLERQRRKGRPGSIAVAVATLGEILLKRAEYSEAEALLCECLTDRLSQKADDWTTLYIRTLFGGALVGREKYDEAEALLVQGYEGMSHCADHILPQRRRSRLIEALERLLQLYNAWGKPDEAARWQQELERVKSSSQTATKGNEP